MRRINTTITNTDGRVAFKIYFSISIYGGVYNIKRILNSRYVCRQEYLENCLFVLFRLQ